MKFEEALAAMRDGKKIRHPTFKENEYLMVCKLKINPILKLSEEEIPNIISVVKMQGEFMSEDMKFKNWPTKQNCCQPELHNNPQLNLLLIMCDDWEIVE